MTAKPRRETLTLDVPRLTGAMAGLEYRCQVIVSGYWSPVTRIRNQCALRTELSFVYVDGDWAAEWSLDNQITAVQASRWPVGGEPVAWSEAKDGDICPHHVFRYVYKSGWGSQSLVDERYLPAAVIDGRWGRVFWVLKDFPESCQAEAEQQANDLPKAAGEQS